VHICLAGECVRLNGCMCVGGSVCVRGLGARVRAWVEGVCVRLSVCDKKR
jgi:hypothetical protein